MALSGVLGMSGPRPVYNAGERSQRAFAGRKRFCVQYWTKSSICTPTAVTMTKSSIDRRAARTRAKLHEALLYLVAKENYQAITVEDICEQANVGRSTFYAHYMGKDDLMRRGLEPLRERLVDRRAAAKDAKRSDFAFSLALFEHARDHAHLHQTLGDRGITVARDAVRCMLCDLVRSELAAAGKNPSGRPPRELVVQYVVGAFIAVTNWWLDSGATLSADQVDAMFRRLVIEGIALPYG